jgi:hypothetical protein
LHTQISLPAISTVHAVLDRHNLATRVRKLAGINYFFRRQVQLSPVTPMIEVVKRLHTEEMAEIAAYLATLHRAAFGPGPPRG